MGLFDLFKKSKPEISKQEPKKPAVPEQDKKYYQQDSYYKDVVFAGTQFEKKLRCLRTERKPQFLQERVCILRKSYCWSIVPTVHILVHKTVTPAFGGLNMELGM